MVIFGEGMKGWSRLEEFMLDISGNNLGGELDHFRFLDFGFEGLYCLKILELRMGYNNLGGNVGNLKFLG